jgi:hypothetical protein
VPGLHDILRHGLRRDGNAHRVRPVRGGDARRDALRRLDGQGEARAVSSSCASTMGGRLSCSQRSRVRARQTRPRARRAMKVMCSASQCSAATITTPSLRWPSRSSRITTMRPVADVVEQFADGTVDVLHGAERSRPGTAGSRCRRAVSAMSPYAAAGQCCGIALQQALEVAGDHVHLEVDPVPGR